MPAPCPGDDTYDPGDVHTADDLARVIRERRRAPRDVVPDADADGWDRVARAAGADGLTFTSHEIVTDVDGLPIAVAEHTESVALARPVGYGPNGWPLLDDELRRRGAPPRRDRDGD